MPEGRLYESPGCMDLSGGPGLQGGSVTGICNPGTHPVQNQCSPVGHAPHIPIRCNVGGQVAYMCNAGSMV